MVPFEVKKFIRFSSFNNVMIIKDDYAANDDEIKTTNDKCMKLKEALRGQANKQHPDWWFKKLEMLVKNKNRVHHAWLMTRDNEDQ